MQNNHSIARKHRAFFMIWMLSAAVQAAGSQSLVRDSLILNPRIRLPEQPPASFRLDTVLDLRGNGNPRLVGMDEVTHYRIVPVDRAILTVRPLADLVYRLFPDDRPENGNVYSLSIDRFAFSRQRMCFAAKRQRVHALMTLYRKSDNDSLAVQGRLVFDSGVSGFSISGDIKKTVTSAMACWMRDLVRDVPAAVRYLEDTHAAERPFYFVPPRRQIPWMQLNARGYFIVTRDGYLIDGRLYFTYPEARRLFPDDAGLIRYRHGKNFESVEYGLLNSALNRRLNDRFLLRFQCHLLAGINRWRDMDTVRHKLYDALILDLSFSQSVNYHPSRVRTPVFGIGFSQSLYYVYSAGVQFRAGLVFNTGIAW